MWEMYAEEAYETEHGKCTLYVVFSPNFLHPPNFLCCLPKHISKAERWNEPLKSRSRSRYPFYTNLDPC